jgi:hypothetical protein
MTKTKIFVVFHKTLDDSVFGCFLDNEIDQWFVKYGVNEKYEKSLLTTDKIKKDIKIAADDFYVPEERSSNVILEYELQTYLPELQSRGFMETSCYVHILKNDLIGDATHVGVTQYDMRWTEASVSIVRSLNNPSNKEDKLAYAMSIGPFVMPDGSPNPAMVVSKVNWKFLLDHYNEFFESSWSWDAVVDKPLTLFQTYILPKRDFIELSAWLLSLCKALFPTFNAPPYETHWGVLGGLTERAESIFFAIRMHENKITFRSLCLFHDPAIAIDLGISKDHYATS